MRNGKRLATESTNNRLLMTNVINFLVNFLYLKGELFYFFFFYIYSLNVLSLFVKKGLGIFKVECILSTECKEWYYNAWFKVAILLCKMMERLRYRVLPLWPLFRCAIILTFAIFWVPKHSNLNRCTLRSTNHITRAYCIQNYTKIYDAFI